MAIFADRAIDAKSQQGPAPPRGRLNIYDRCVEHCNRLLAWAYGQSHFYKDMASCFAPFRVQGRGKDSPTDRDTRLSIIFAVEQGKEAAGVYRLSGVRLRTRDAACRTQK
jgi:hypothetical protein